MHGHSASERLPQPSGAVLLQPSFMQQDDRRPTLQGQVVGWAFGRLYSGADAAKHPGPVKSQMCFSWIERWAEKERQREAICA